MASHADCGNRYLGTSSEACRKQHANEGLQNRITLRRQNITDLSDQKTFDFIWVPTMFLPISIVDRITPLIVQALVPGGFVALGMFAAAPGP